MRNRINWDLALVSTRLNLWVMAKICIRYVWKMLKRCPIDIWDMTEKFLIYPQDMPEISVRNGGNKPLIWLDNMTVFWTFSNSIP